MTVPQTTPEIPILAVRAMLSRTLMVAITVAVITWDLMTCAPFSNMATAFPTALMVVHTPTARISPNVGWTAEVPTQIAMIGIPKATSTAELDPATASDSRSDRSNVLRTHSTSPRPSASR